MRTKFWRFEYNQETLAQMASTTELILPDLSRKPMAKNSRPEKILADIRVGDFLFLANYDRTTQIGTANLVGRVKAKNGDQPVVDWKKPIPSLAMTPNIQGGVNVWETESVFCFDVQPAKRYKLDARTKKLFRGDL